MKSVKNSNYHGRGILIAPENNKIPRKTTLSFFAIYCGWPVCFYMVFMYFNPILKENFGYSSADIIFHNLLLALISFLSSLCVSFLSYRYYPLYISKIKAYLFFALVILLPFIITYANNPYLFFSIQALLLLTSIGDCPSAAIFIKHIPVLKRVTATSFIYAATRAIMYIITTFGLFFLTEWFGHFGLWIVTIPVTIAFLWGIKHFETLEQEKGIIPKRKDTTPSDTKENITLAA